MKAYTTILMTGSFVIVAALATVGARAEDAAKKTEGPRVGAQAQAYSSKTKAYLSLSIRGCPGKFLGIDKTKFELSSWKDNLGNPIGSKQAGKDEIVPGGGKLAKVISVKGSRFVNSKKPIEVTVRVDQAMHEDAEECTAKGCLTVRYAQEKKTGEVKGVSTTVGNTFTLEGITFTVAKNKKQTLGGKTNYWITVKCNPKHLLKGEYGFVDKFSIYDEKDAPIKENTNQKNNSSEGGFFYLWVVPHVPSKVNIRYSCYPEVTETRIPFLVEASMN